MKNPLVTQGASADVEVQAEHRTYTADGSPVQVFCRLRVTP